MTEPSERLSEIIADAFSGGVNIVQRRDLALKHWRKWPKLRRKIVGSSLLFADSNGGQSELFRGQQLPEAYKAMNARAIREGFGFDCVGRSVHSVEVAKWAVQDGADYIVAGTIYPSQSHPDELGRGVKFLRDVCTAVAPLPVIAIGGITPERVGECIAVGAAGVAVLSPIMRAADPQAMAQAYRIELDRAWSLRSTENR